MKLLTRLFNRLREKICKHEFAIEDLRMVSPDSGGDDRVEWPCEKCGHIFAAQCGLDISPKHGFTRRREPYNA